MLIRLATLLGKFALLISLTYYLPASDVGLYGLMVAISAYATFFIGFEYYNYVQRIIVDCAPGDQKRIIQNQFILYVLIFTFIVLPTLLGMYYCDLIPKPLIYFLIPIILVDHVSTELMRLLNILYKPQESNITLFIRQAAWVFLLLPLLYVCPTFRNLNVVFISWFLGTLLSISYALRSMPRFAIFDNLPIKTGWEEIKKGVVMSQPFLITAFCALSMLYLERFFINYYQSDVELGVYTFFSGISIALHSLVNACVAKMRFAQLLTAGNSSIKNHCREELNLEYRKMFKLTVLVVAALLMTSLIIMRPLLDILNKEAYIMHQPIFYYLILGAACRSIADAPLYVLYAQHKDISLLNLNLLSFVILLTGNIILIPTYGIYGAAITSMIASIVLLISSLITASKVNKKFNVQVQV